MRFVWDENKRLQLLHTRGIDFANIYKVFDHNYHLSQKRDDPEQWRAIGWVDGRLVTIIYEERWDVEGDYFWIVTGWVSTVTERNLYSET